MFDSFPHAGNVLVQGASRGIGLEFVRQCLAAPSVSHVVATCRNPAAATGLNELRVQHVGRLTITSLDLLDDIRIASPCTARHT